jgi:hypothetical protein
MCGNGTAASVLCLWCNRVITWGKVSIDYDVCPACMPRLLDALDALEEGGRRRDRPWSRFFQKRAIP